MIYHKLHIYKLCALHELYECDSSKLLHEKMIYNMIHICDLCDLYELCICVSLKSLLQKMICHKIHICDLCDLYELCIYVSLRWTGFKRIPNLAPSSLGIAPNSMWVLYTSYQPTFTKIVFRSRAPFLRYPKAAPGDRFGQKSQQMPWRCE